MLGSSFHLGTTELSRIVIVATLHWISNAPLPMLELFSSRISVDQDLSVIVVEIDNDDDVKQRLVSIIFHASVTQQRSSGSKTRISCSHVHENNQLPTLANKGSRKRKPHKLMLKARRNLETRLIVQQCAQQHIPPTMFACRQKKGKDTTVEISTKEPRIPENMVGTKNTNNFKNTHLVHSRRT